MKIKHLLIGLFAVAAAVACKQEEPVVTPKLDVDKTAVQVAATAGEASFNVTSNQSWVATADADWVSLEPASGQASEKAVAVKVTAEDNETTEARKATVTVKAGELTKTVEVNQAAGAGEEPGPGPEPGPDAATYLLVGDAVGGWNFDNPVVLTLTEGYYVAKSVAVTAQKGMHFTKNSSWEGNVKGLHGLIAPNEIGEVGSNDISLTEGGNFDVYLTEALDKFYFMSEGKLPSEAVEHVEIATVWGVCGAIEGNSWGNSADPVMEKEGEWFVAKNVVFTEVNFKVRGNNSWADDLKWGSVSKDQKCELNKAIAVSTCAEYKATTGTNDDNPNVYIEAPAGTYDIYFSPDKKEVWVMTPGYKPGDEVPVVPAPGDFDIDGKQWTFAWQGMGGASCVIDLGVTESGVAILAYDMGVLDPSYAGIYYPYMMGAYTIAKTDGTSGVVTLSADGQSVDIPYSNATENSVHFATAALLDGENIDCTLATSLIEISTGAAEGLADGEYWIIADGKVATPLTGSFGYLQVTDAVDGKSTAANAFTFTQVEAGLYTIQDSNGKYYYQTGDYNSFNVADEDGMTDDYLWEVYDSGNGEFVIMNLGVAKFMQYDSGYNTFGSYSDERGTLPTLVPAEDPIAEPEPEEPVVPETVLTLTNAEICAAMTSSSTSYATYTIESASGNWTVNASQNKSNTFLQCRGKKGGYIKTPEFDKDIKCVTIHFTTAKSVYANNTYCVFPSTWTAPTADAAYPEDGNVGKAVTDGSYSLTIPVDAGNKQVYISIIGTYAYYLDHIDVGF